VRFAYYDTYTNVQYKPAILENKRLLLDTRTEIRVRAQYFVDVARYVAGKIAESPDPANSRVLTIFAAPEFYLRCTIGQSDGPGHYDQKDVTNARTLIKDSVRLDSRFDDWLLVPGTAVYSNSYPSWLIWNDAYCVAKADQQIKQWHCIKQTFSEYDQLDPKLNAFSQNHTPLGLVYQQIMSLNGVDIGLEICLDHYNAALKNTVLTSNPPLNVDVQLMVSCGSDIDSQNVGTRSLGLVLRCNGDEYQPPPGNVYRVGMWKNGRPAAADTPPSLSNMTSTCKILPLPAGLQIRPDKTKTDTAGYCDPLPLRLTPPPPPPPRP
jgi:hypothetical protein